MQDVVIIGGGISGCSLLYELSRYQIKATLLEKENDISAGATKANSAIVHAGYDPEPGTKMAKYNVDGNRMIEKICADLDVLYNKVGSLVVGMNDADRATIQTLYDRGVENGVPGLRILEKEELHELEPNLSEQSAVALYAPSAAIVNPWELALAQAEAAVEGGAELLLNTKVNGIRVIEGGYAVDTDQGEIQTRFLVNAAGAHADDICHMLGEDFFSIHPLRGQYYLLDTSQGELVNHVIFPCPTKEGKGVLVSPTVHGNLIVGPNSEPVDKDDLSTSTEGLAFVKSASTRFVPSINFRESIRNFSGIRAATEIDDFIVGESEQNPGFFYMAGIKSPGLSSAPAMALDIVEMLKSAGLEAIENPNFQKKRKVLRFKNLSDHEKTEAIRKNPLYGTIVCRCETVTEGEIVDALHRPIPPSSVDGIKRRCTPGMGRCQGGFCGPKVQAIIARELGISQLDIPLDRVGMDIIIGNTKERKEVEEA